MKRVFCLVAIFMLIVGCKANVKNNDAPDALWYKDREINLVIMTAWDHFSAERYDQALYDFERLIAKGYDHYDVLFGAAQSSLKKNDRVRALKYFSQCLTRRPDHFDCLYFRGELFYQMKDSVHARAVCNAVLQCELKSPIICGLYSSRHADNGILKQRQIDAKRILEKP